MRSHAKCLVLNADYSPIGVSSWSCAMNSMYKDTVNVIDFYKHDFIQGTAGRTYPVPAVVVCRDYIKPSGEIPYSKSNVFIRDRLTCQYCGRRFSHRELTVDHVIPRSKWTKEGSPSNWLNIVSACKPCNNRKADMFLSECRMKLIKEVKLPSPHMYIKGLKPWHTIQPEWLPYLPKHFLDLAKLG